MEPSKKSLNVFCFELTSNNSYLENQKVILSSLSKINPEVQDFETLVCFPENCLYFRLEKNETIPFIKLEDKIFDPICEVAKEKKLNILLGSVPLIINGENFTSTVFINNKGERSAPYQKMHLFDLNLPELKIEESKEFKPGKSPGMIQVGEFKIGLTICFDLRFSWLFEYYRTNEVDLICIPAAFTVPTGKVHWETLIKARAIENQCFIVAAAQGGNHEGKRETFGHGMIVGPWGEVKAMTKGNFERVVNAILSKNEIQKVKTNLPIIKSKFSKNF